MSMCSVCSTRSWGKRWTVEKSGTVSLSQVSISIIIIIITVLVLLLLLSLLSLLSFINNIATEKNISLTTIVFEIILFIPFKYCTFFNLFFFAVECRPL